MWSDLVAHFRVFGSVQTSVPIVKLKNDFDSDKKTGIDFQWIKSSVSREQIKIIWPDSIKDRNILTQWIKTRLDKIAKGEFITIALSSESKPLSIQLGDIFPTNVDPRTTISSVQAKNGLIIFLIDKRGEKNYFYADELSKLLNNNRITIATFDCTMTLLNLEAAGIKYCRECVIDCQLHGLPIGIEYLKYTQGNLLSRRIEYLSINDPLLKKAQRIIQTESTFPRDANEFMMKAYHLPVTAMITIRFLKNSANQIIFTALAFAEIVHEHQFKTASKQTQEKLKEFQRAQEQFGQNGPFFIRQLSLLQRECATLQGSVPIHASTDCLLGRWRKLLEMIQIGSFSNQQKIELALQETERVLNEPERLKDVEILANIAVPSPTL
jgi:hypothetical protein